jgi:hypothetical protein
MNKNWATDTVIGENDRKCRIRTPLIFHILFALVITVWIGFIIGAILQTVVYALKDKVECPTCHKTMVEK